MGNRRAGASDSLHRAVVSAPGGVSDRYADLDLVPHHVPGTDPHPAHPALPCGQPDGSSQPTTNPRPWTTGRDLERAATAPPSPHRYQR